MLLRHIPPLPDNADSRKFSNPPQEHELSFEQRLLVRAAHRHIRLYDVGFKKNWAQVFGWSRPWGWIYRLLIGGSWYVFLIHTLILRSAYGSLPLLYDPTILRCQHWGW